MRWMALLALGACTAKGEGDETGATLTDTDTDTDTTTADTDTDVPLVATADDPYVIAYAGCTATFTTTVDGRVDVTGTYEYDANGDRVREVVDYGGDEGTVERTREYAALHQVSRVVTGTSADVYTWTDGHVTRIEYGVGDDGTAYRALDQTFDGDFLGSRHSYDPNGQSGWQRTSYTWTHSGTDHTAVYTDAALEFAGNGTAVADDAGNLLEQAGTTSTTLSMEMHQTAPNAIGERTHYDRRDFYPDEVSHSTTADWTLDELGRVVTHEVVDVDLDYDEEPKETVTITEYTYDCP